HRSTRSAGSSSRSECSKCSSARSRRRSAPAGTEAGGAPMNASAGDRRAGRCRPMSANQVALWYLVASICFILALKGLSHPSTARRGNLFGIAGMVIAVVVTLALVYSHTKNVGMILAGIVVGGAIGVVVARRVQ